MTTTASEKLLYSPEEAAGMLGVSRSQVFELIARHQIESIKVGRLRKFPHDALLAYIERLRAEQSVPA
jgi:excisionase family DNA binding protein